MLHFNQHIEALFHIGVDADTDKSVAKHMAITLQLTLTWIPLVSIFLLTFYLGGAPVFTRGMAFLLATHIVVFYLSKLKWFVLTRILEIIVPVSVVQLGCAFDFPQDLHIRSLFSMYMVSFSVLPFLFFTLQEKKYIVFSYLWIIVAWLSFDYLNARFGSVAAPSLYQSEVFVYLCGIGAMLLLLSSVLIFKTINYQYENTIKVLAEQTKNQNEEITQQSYVLEKQNQSLVKQQKNIVHSLNYASHIQSIVFPESVISHTIIKESFTLFRPRDIVSGDFMWHRELDGRLLICVADCTGHGVPGALTGMLAATFLNEIVGYNSTLSTADILNRLNLKIGAMLQSDRKKDLYYHGLDVAIISIDTKTLLAQFASARNSLLLLRKNQLTEIKGNKDTIGIASKHIEFSNISFPLKRNDQVYMFTDGYADQLNKPFGSKIKKSKLKQILLENKDLSMKEQHWYLSKYLNEWQADYEQVDDILIIGMTF